MSIFVDETNRLRLDRMMSLISFLFVASSVADVLFWNFFFFTFGPIGDERGVECDDGISSKGPPASTVSSWPSLSDSKRLTRGSSWVNVKLPALSRGVEGGVLDPTVDWLA